MNLSNLQVDKNVQELVLISLIRTQLLMAAGGHIYTRMGLNQCDKIMKVFIASVTNLYKNGF